MMSQLTTQTQQTDRITIGISEMSLGKDTTLLITIGLGSCIGIALWDPITNIGGLSHIMLPDSDAIRNHKKFNPGKFANTAIPLLVDYMVKAGAVKRRIVAKIAGGAQMFKFSRFNVGKRNYDAVKIELQNLKINLKAEDCLGDKGRTILFNCQNGVLIVKKIEQDMKKL
jgi:chemotaxis protein CheD